METTKVTVYYESAPSGEYSKTEIINWINDAFDRVPAEHRDAAKIELEVDNSYGDTIIETFIRYERPCTGHEINERKEKIARATALREAREREEFERLKKKFS